MRIIIKGGMWKNTEDEILKAAVMKYGKNQWARISSLLTRKTPTQCKARWFEWLDPSIKKTEWSKEEDEKLLHLAKLMPTQWRTIAPIVGRTAAQCLERYQRLLDEAEAGEDDRGPTSDDVRRLRPGEIDPEPEAKPARPDPVDMDEDEKEMLSEARARLANTQGKKAKRKAREKQLEEARRLASLQKRRELKEAGVDTKIRRKITGMDYNADIPFYKSQPAGFWDINDEIAREAVDKVDLTNALLSKLDGKRRIEVEEQERKNDAKRQKIKKDKGEYVPPKAVRAAAESMQMSARNKLVLPAPQVSEAELEEIVKIGSAGESMRSIVDAEGASQSLLSDYSTFRAPTPLRTPRAVGTEDTLKQQARNLRAMTESQTPLLGQDVHLEGSVEFNGATPKRSVLATPNPLAAHLTPRAAGIDGTPARGSVAGTPRTAAVAGGLFGGRTPMRDPMGINTPRSDFGSSVAGGETPRAIRSQQDLVRRQLAEHFAALPQPKNDFEIVIPDLDDDEAADGGLDADMDGMLGGGRGGGRGDADEDAEEVETRELERRKRETEAKLKRRSMAVQRGLPRPVVSLQAIEALYSDDNDIPASASASASHDHADTDIEALIRREMALLVQRDAVFHPMQGQPPLPASALLPKLDKLSDSLLADAAALIRDEVEASPRDADTAYVYSPLTRTMVHAATLADTDLVAIRKAVLGEHRAAMKSAAVKAQKMEKKMAVTLGGYAGRSKKLAKELDDVARELDDTVARLDGFRRLRVGEEAGLSHRVETARRELAGLALMEQDLQDAYREKVRVRDELLASR
ncbi:pre-mRNA splicing factor component-domain-containing protein [Entophlyctis helioformis]|nr:pre-mRNA splicing factor component-domain-containing protein [Entophlyctis helioformis]